MFVHVDIIMQEVGVSGDSFTLHLNIINTETITALQFKALVASFLFSKVAVAIACIPMKLWFFLFKCHTFCRKANSELTLFGVVRTSPFAGPGSKTNSWSFLRSLNQYAREDRYFVTYSL